MGRKTYDEQLENLHKDLISMGTLVEESIHLALQALVEKNMDYAEKVIERDREINALELKIEQGCFTVIALQQPMGRDLRRIGTMLKVSTDLERMGDYAVNIAKAALRLRSEEYVKPLVDTPKLGKLVTEMVRDVLNAYIEVDTEKAKEIAERDDQVDHLYKLIVTDAISIMQSDESLVNQGTQFLFVAQYLERIADHVTNVCEWIHYLKTGEMKEMND